MYECYPVNIPSQEENKLVWSDVPLKSQQLSGVEMFLWICGSFIWEAIRLVFDFYSSALL